MSHLSPPVQFITSFDPLDRLGVTSGHLISFILGKYKPIDFYMLFTVTTFMGKKILRKYTVMKFIFFNVN